MATYIRLTDYKDSDSKEQGFFKSENRYEAKQSDFEKIPGSPIAYWVRKNLKNNFDHSQQVKDIAKVRVGMHTGSNDLFIRLWNELNFNSIGFNCSSEETTKDLDFK